VFAGYSEKALGIDRHCYFNAGILLMDLEQMRSAELERAFVGLMNRFRFRVAQDQDYLNVLCNGSVKYLPLTWNKTAFPDSESLGLPSVIHFKLNFKPWRYYGVAFENVFWSYAALTPYYEQMKEERNAYTEEERERDKKQYDALALLAMEETANAENLKEPLPVAYSMFENVVRGC